MQYKIFTCFFLKNNKLALRTKRFSCDELTVKVKVGCQHESLYFYYESLSVFSTNTFLLLLKFEEIIRQMHSEKNENKTCF
jgi:hypothetical protein